MTTTKVETQFVRPLNGGLIPVPAEILVSLGIDEHTTLRITVENGELRITPVGMQDSDKGSPGLKALYEYFAPVREEIRAHGISQEELYADIDEAIAEVRAEERAKRE